MFLISIIELACASNPNFSTSANKVANTNTTDDLPYLKEYQELYEADLKHMSKMKEFKDYVKSKEEFLLENKEKLCESLFDLEVEIIKRQEMIISHDKEIEALNQELSKSGNKSLLDKIEETEEKKGQILNEIFNFYLKSEEIKKESFLIDKNLNKLKQYTFYEYSNNVMFQL